MDICLIVWSLDLYSVGAKLYALDVVHQRWGGIDRCWRKDKRFGSVRSSVVVICGREELAISTTLTIMSSVKLATTLTIMVLIAFTFSGTMAQGFGAAPAPSPSLESDGTVLQVSALLAAVVSLVAYMV
ncbi:hypothetical protein QVD17_18120 [Tagetes erecta]|uniref:Uncharacterized protein n=1 Tax=Tagetes erecta TaxID=13708 RepID=A0AAD8KKK4_TARER|nr:hypothetical protein QVD17_18120 [Tagetes erecta]